MRSKEWTSSKGQSNTLSTGERVLDQYASQRARDVALTLSDSHGRQLHAESAAVRLERRGSAVGRRPSQERPDPRRQRLAHDLVARRVPMGADGVAEPGPARPPNGVG